MQPRRSDLGKLTDQHETAAEDDGVLPPVLLPNPHGQESANEGGDIIDGGDGTQDDASARKTHGVEIVRTDIDTTSIRISETSISHVSGRSAYQRHLAEMLC